MCVFFYCILSCLSITSLWNNKHTTWKSDQLNYYPAINLLVCLLCSLIWFPHHRKKCSISGDDIYLIPDDIISILGKWPVLQIWQPTHRYDHSDTVNAELTAAQILAFFSKILFPREKMMIIWLKYTLGRTHGVSSLPSPIISRKLSWLYQRTCQICFIYVLQRLLRLQYANTKSYQYTCSHVQLFDYSWARLIYMKKMDLKQREP